MKTGLTMFLVVLAGIAINVWVLWTAWIILVGGTIPLLEVEVGSSLLLAVVWVVFLAPISFYLAGMLVTGVVWLVTLPFAGRADR